MGLRGIESKSPRSQASEGWGMKLSKADILNSFAIFPFYKTNNLKIKFNDKVKPWCLDGEKYDSKEKKYVFTTNKKVKMLVPTVNISKLFIKK